MFLPLTEAELPVYERSPHGGKSTLCSVTEGATELRAEIIARFGTTAPSSKEIKILPHLES